MEQILERSYKSNSFYIVGHIQPILSGRGHWNSPLTAHLVPIGFKLQQTIV